MNKSKSVAFAGICCALSVVLLFLGGAIWAFAYLMPIVTGLIMIFLIECFSKKTAFLTYFATSLLSLVLIADKECSLFYVLFFGYYPFIRDVLCRIKPNFLSYIFRLIFFNVCMISVQLICIYAFNIPFDDFLGKWGIILFAIGLNLIFVVYDRLLVLLTILFNKKIKPKINKYLK